MKTINVTINIYPASTTDDNQLNRMEFKTAFLKIRDGQLWMADENGTEARIQHETMVIQVIDGDKEHFYD